MNAYQDAAAIILERIQGLRPRIALVLGSGLCNLAEGITDSVVISYQDLPGFPVPTVNGHAGRLLAGTLHNVTVLCMQGRTHYYEGCSPGSIALPIRALHAAGCDALMLTNAAGSLRKNMGAGSLMMLTDHINWAGINPLIGPNEETVGPRFPDMTQAYDPVLRGQLREAAVAAAIELFEGTYLMCAGPNFETPAEIRAFALLGADAVGMSTVPESLVANHCGMRVAALSVITNLAAGIASHPLSHTDTLSAGTLAAEKLSRLLRHFLPRLTQ